MRRGGEVEGHSKLQTLAFLGTRRRRRGGNQARPGVDSATKFPDKRTMPRWGFVIVCKAKVDRLKGRRAAVLFG